MGADASLESLGAQRCEIRQICVRADRRSLKNQHGKPLREAMTYEWHNGREALCREGIRGAGQFSNPSEKD
ncbi:MAG: hypothetical protein HOG18_06490 [Proteobacteria bacterium]|nr:hypothetical protein [Pseudomonadota bacterium]MBT6931985.1 hypothetical protein [Pseudomonadota bacterium]